MNAKLKTLATAWSMYKKGQISMGTIMLVFVTVVLGMALFPSIIEITNNVSAEAGGTTATLVALVPVFYAILLIAVVIVEVAVGFKGLN